MNSFAEMLKYYSLNEHIFGLGNNPGQQEAQDAALPQEPLSELMCVGKYISDFTVPPSPGGGVTEHFALRPADGTIYDPEPGVVFSEYGDYSPEDDMSFENDDDTSYEEFFEDSEALAQLEPSGLQPETDPCDALSPFAQLILKSDVKWKSARGAVKGHKTLIPACVDCPENDLALQI